VDGEGPAPKTSIPLSEIAEVTTCEKKQFAFKVSRLTENHPVFLEVLTLHPHRNPPNPARFLGGFQLPRAGGVDAGPERRSELPGRRCQPSWPQLETPGSHRGAGVGGP
jgi:hypothetical protein